MGNLSTATKKAARGQNTGSHAAYRPGEYGNMKAIPKQVTMSEYDDDYRAFVEKFKPKKTTDDCYTPPNVFEAVAGWVMSEYGISEEQIVRPFWPGGDYERYPYKETDVVLDNPPFSIITPIVKFYNAHEIKFFLFAPHLTNLGIGTDSVCHVIENVKVTYDNGAVVNTSFVTNLDDHLIVASPELYAAVKKADDENCKGMKPELPAYEYPANIVTATEVGQIVERGVPYKLRRDDAFHIRALDHQRQHGKAIFGSGFLISDRAATEKAEAKQAAKAAAAMQKERTVERHVWKLSDAERVLVEQLNERTANE